MSGKFIHGKDEVIVDNTDLSGFAFSIDTPQEKEQIDVSGFNATGSREYLPGQEDSTITIGFLQGFGSNEPHQVLYPIYSSGSTCTIYVRKDMTSGTSATDPRFGGTANIYTYNGLSGELNARGEVTAVFKPAPNSVFAWSTS